MLNNSHYETNLRKVGVSSILQLVVIYFLSVLLLGFAYMASRMLEVPIEHMTADPALIYGGHPLTGIVSNFGVLLWCITASICLFSFFLLRRYRNDQAVRFLLYSGLITLFLCLDDLLMLHEGIFPWHLNIPQPVVYLIYTLILGSFFLYYLKHIFRSEYIIFIIALIFLSSSVLCDFVIPQYGIYYFIEDALKLFGIGTWFAFYFRYSIYYLDYYPKVN